MANLQGFYSGGLQGLSNRLQGFGGGVSYIYLTNLPAGVIRVYDTSGTPLTDITNIISGITYQVRGVSVYKDKIYICANTTATGTLDLIHVFDRSGSHLYSFGNRDNTGIPAAGSICFAEAIAVHEDFVYVSDHNTPSVTPFCYVSKFSLDGTYISRFASYGDADGECGLVSSLYGYNEEIYVADNDVGFANNNRVQVFDLDGNFLRKWGTTGTGDGEFDKIRSVYARNGLVYTSEVNPFTPHARIQVFDTDGVFVDSFGSYGNGPLQFEQVSSVRIFNGQFYILDTSNSRIQIVDSGFNYVSEFSDNMVTPVSMDIG